MGDAEQKLKFKDHDVVAWRGIENLSQNLARSVPRHENGDWREIIVVMPRHGLLGVAAWDLLCKKK